MIQTKTTKTESGNEVKCFGKGMKERVKKSDSYNL